MSTFPRTATESTGADVIHDIGYRPYTGERLGRGYATRSLFVHSARGAYGLSRSAISKVLPMLLFAAVCLPALIIVAVVIMAEMDEMPFEFTDYVIFVVAVPAIFVAAQAPQLLSKDLRFATVPLYFSRPLTRSDYVRAKFAAMTVATFVLLATPLVILYVGALLAELPFGEHTEEFLGSLVGAVAFSLLLAGLSLVIASVTPRRGLGVAAIITVLMVSYGFASTLQGIAEDSGDAAGHTAAGWFGLLSPFTLADGVQSWLTGTEVAGITGPPGTAGGVVFLLVFIGSIGACYGLLVRRYRRL
ncbi:MAG: ABC transporter permease [Candidatus Nanopelagicales bacterium]